MISSRNVETAFNPVHQDFYIFTYTAHSRRGFFSYTPRTISQPPASPAPSPSLVRPRLTLVTKSATKKPPLA